MKTEVLRGIRSWPEKERPREKLFQQGVRALSDAELIAVLLRNGTRGRDAVVLARDILRQAGRLRGLLSKEPLELVRLPGMGQAKAASLLATAEIACRHLREQVLQKSLIQDPEAMMSYLYASLRDKKREVFEILFLDKAHRLIEDADLSHGTVDATAVYPREAKSCP